MQPQGIRTRPTNQNQSRLKRLRETVEDWTMNGVELKAAIESGGYWSECWSPFCDAKMHDDYTLRDDDEHTSTIRTSQQIPEAVFCSRQCRLKAERHQRDIEHRWRRTIAKAFQSFGREMVFLNACGESRSGACSCADPQPFMAGTVDLKLPGLMYSISGCPWCKNWHVSRCDVEAFQQFKRLKNATTRGFR